MALASGVILGLAYILGLLSTAIPWGGYGILALGVGAAFVLPRFWPAGPKRKIWLLAGFVGCLASLYFQLRLPEPEAGDISQLIPTADIVSQAQVITVQGEVASTPRLTRSQRAQFWLKANQINEVTGRNGPATGGQKVTGKVYVTVPLLQATGLRPNQAIAVTGSLYKPKTAANPGSFDFQAYLAQEGGFAGLSGRQISLPEDTPPPKWGLWTIRQRIIRAQVQGLGSPGGPLVSAMVLGGRVVDLSYDVRDQFARIGLAHTLAASGFHVSLILGLVLALTRRFSSRAQFACGVIALASFVGLTGLQPSVLRAAIMGFGALIALVMRRKVKPIGSLILAATLLLLFNPLWIWNLGFQLSLLATLGLLVSVPPLMKRLDWLPPTIATLVAVPIAAYLWTLPLQLYAFGLVSPYSILASVVTTPLVSGVSIGGIISALASLPSPWLGSAIAWLLYYPVHWLIGIVEFLNGLPGASVAVGNISLWQLIILYSLIGLVWLQSWWQRRWRFAALLAVCLVVIPAWQVKADLFRVTVLATSREPVLVVEDQGQVALINSGDESTASLTVLPFLRYRGINHVNWAIATESWMGLQQGWLQILEGLSVKDFYDCSVLNTTVGSGTPSAASYQAILQAIQKHRGNYQPISAGQTLQIGSTSARLINASPTILQLQIRNEQWLLVDNLKSTDQKALVSTNKLPATQVLWWSGEPLSADLLQALKPQVAIASSTSVDPETVAQLQKRKIQLYWTGRDGALQWTPQDGLETTLESSVKDW